LLTQIDHNTGRHIRGINQKRTQKAHGTELQGKAQTIRRAPTLSHQRLLGIVEMKKARQLGRGGFARIAPILLRLLVGQKRNRHLDSFQEEDA
jgi:hypothetical protein